MKKKKHKHLNKDLKDLMDDESGMITHMLKVFDFDPDEEHTYDALRDLERLIDARYPEGHEPLPTTLIPFGWYLAHTLVSNLEGAVINTDVDSIWDVSVNYIPEWKDEGKTPSPVCVFPFKRAGNFWKHREDRMSSMLEMTMVLAKKHPEEISKLADDDGWVTLESGTMIRALVVEQKEDGSFTDGKVKLNASKLISGLEE